MTTCACANCQFFDAQTDAKVRQMDGTGLCRYNPPMPSASDARAAWPVVGKDDWCCHFAATVERMMPAAACPAALRRLVA